MPTLILPDKICPHCGGTKWITSFTKKGSITHTCVIKKKEYDKKWAVNAYEIRKAQWKRRYDKVKNNEIVKQNTAQRAKKWAKENPEKVKASIKVTTLKYKEKYNEVTRKRAKYYVENLSDCYIASAINAGKGIYLSDIPQELIELKRKQLLLTRTIRNNGN